MDTTKTALISITSLKDLLNDNSRPYKIIDATSSKDALEEYKLKHIPGALFFGTSDCIDKSTNLLPASEMFENYVGALGINNDTHVIVYDNHPKYPSFWAPRVWWMFRVFGHNKVSVLDGGLPKWISENGPTTADIVNVSKEKFHASYRGDLVKNFADIKDNIKSPGFQLADARPEGKFNGTVPEARNDVKAGHIPGSINIPYMSVSNEEKRCMRSPEELKNIFASAGIDLKKPFVALCSAGLISCILVHAAYECGNDKVAVYDGAWTEWYLKAPDDLKMNVPSD